MQLHWNVVPPELIVELTQVEVVEQNITAVAYLEESSEFGVNSMKKQVTRILDGIQPAVYDSGDFGRETSHGIANEYVPKLESRPKSSRPRRDFDTTRPRLGAKSRDETET